MSAAAEDYRLSSTFAAKQYADKPIFLTKYCVAFLHSHVPTAFTGN